MIAIPKQSSKMTKEKLELAMQLRNKRKERQEQQKKMLELPDVPHSLSLISKNSQTFEKVELATQLKIKMKELEEHQKKMLLFHDKISTSTRLSFSKEQYEIAEKLEEKMKDLQGYQQKLLDLQEQTSIEAKLTTALELQLEEKDIKLEAAIKERDKVEREFTSAKSEVATLKRTLELERQERKDLETTALDLIKGAKRKWETAEKDKIARLNKHIEAQTVRITELCTSNNEMSSRLQRTQCDLETANAELHKLKVFQIQYKESLAKTRELRRQSVQGVENKLEEIANRAHNQLAEVRMKLEMEISKSTELEAQLRNERDSNHCHMSRINVALELAQSELKDCQEHLRSTQSMIPARDQEIETLRKQLKERSMQMDGISVYEQTIASLKDEITRLKLENEQMKTQLESAKSDLNDTLKNLRRSETLAQNLEKKSQDKDELQLKLEESQEKENEQLRKMDTLEELLQRLQQSVTNLENENACLKRTSDKVAPSTSVSSRVSTGKYNSEKITLLEEQVERLEKQLQTARENAASEREAARQVQRSLWKKEKELSDTGLDKRIALREVKTSEEKIKNLEEELKKVKETLNKKHKDEEEKSKKLLVELQSAKSSLTQFERESSRNKLQADSAQRALTQTNKQVEELQASSAALRRELDAARKQVRTNQDRVDSLNAENKRLTLAISKHNEEKLELESKLEKLEQIENSYKLNIELLKETCTVLEEQLTDYERLTSDHETRENTLIQDKMKLQKELENVEQKLREAKVTQNEEKTKRLVAERTMERLESETSDIEGERNSLFSQRDQYKKLAQDLNKQVHSLTAKCGELECDIAELQRSLEAACGEAIVVKEESSQHLTRLHEMKDINQDLVADLQSSIDQGQELRLRIMELENVLEEMRQFYQEHELKSEGTRQQQTKLIDYLQLKLEECGKKKKTVCEKIFKSKQKENIPPTGAGMPVGYRELENQLARERAKVKALTEQILAYKAAVAAAPSVSVSPRRSPEPKKPNYEPETDEPFVRQMSSRIRHNIPHRYNIEMSMRAGKCAACLEPIQFGRRSAICSECQIMTHLKCSLSTPANCGLPGDFAKHLDNKSWKRSAESISTLTGSVQTLTIDEPDHAQLDSKNPKRTEGVTMESWVKIPGRGKASWDRKYLRLEDFNLCIYEHEPSAGMSPITRMELGDKSGFTISEDVLQAEVPGTAKSDLPFILRVESNTSNTCWPTSRLDIMALGHVDKKSWLNALKSIAYQNGPKEVAKNSMLQTILRLEKNRLDLNCIVELEDENTLLIGAEEGLYSYQPAKSKVLTAIRGVKKIHQLSLHPHLNLALMIAGEDRQLVSCDLRQLRSNAVAAECSRPAINIQNVLTGTESCHLYQLEGDMLCAATGSYVMLLKWHSNAEIGEFIAMKEIETQEPCSCAIFTQKNLIVGCQKFFQIDIKDYSVDDFPEEDDSSVKAALAGIAKIGIFPVAVLDISTAQSTEILLCYNEFGMFVNECGQRTRSLDPTWSHLPFAFAFRRPYLFIIHFSSVEVIKLTPEAFRSASKVPEKTLIELSNPRYLGLAGLRGVYAAVTSSTLEVQRIDGVASILSRRSASLSSLDSFCNNDDSSSEFSFTPSLLETLDNPSKRVHFANLSNRQ